MAVFQAFFDGSGDPQDPNVHVFGLGGWIAPEARWLKLERAWTKICAREGVSALHMKDFAHSKGEFSSWKGDESRRQQFLSDLVKTIRTYTNRDFSQQMFLDGYRAVDAQFEFHERLGHPYALAALMVINQVRDWMKKSHPSDDVMFIFEKGDTYQSELIDLLRRDKIDLGIEPIFMEKRWTVGETARTVPALECADFLSYELNKAMSDLYLRRKGKVRSSMAALAGDGSLFQVKGRGFNIVDGLLFETLTQGYKLPRRPGVSPAPIPHEMESVKQIMGDHFQGRPHRRINVKTDRTEPLPKLRGR